MCCLWRENATLCLVSRSLVVRYEHNKVVLRRHHECFIENYQKKGIWCDSVLSCGHYDIRSDTLTRKALPALSESLALRCVATRLHKYLRKKRHFNRVFLLHRWQCWLGLSIIVGSASGAKSEFLFNTSLRTSCGFLACRTMHESSKWCSQMYTYCSYNYNHTGMIVTAMVSSGCYHESNRAKLCSCRSYCPFARRGSSEGRKICLFSDKGTLHT